MRIGVDIGGTFAQAVMTLTMMAAPPEMLLRHLLAPGRIVGCHGVEQQALPRVRIKETTSQCALTAGVQIIP